ncbi:MAG TPA: hypothetical protein VFI76_07505, partial [Terrimicrobiaceae bacterium]|nr:hypothetical protein [Terrimicrobiaceae bacterium]
DEPGTTAGLLVPVMRRGKRLAESRPLADIRQYTASQLEQLPDRLRSLDPSDPYPVTISKALRGCAQALDQHYVQQATK